MKKIIYFLSFATLCIATNAQNATPNGSFESWTSNTYDVPTPYANSNTESFFKCNTGFNVVKTNDFYHGNFAVQLTTHISTDTCFGYMVSTSNPNGGNPCQWSGGIPYTQTPTGIMGYYKSNISNPDSGGILVAFKNNSVCLGLYMYKFGGVHNAYTPFSFTFNPPLAGAPDTMIFGAVSSDVFSGMALNNSMLQLDSVSLIGVTQPAAMNGDFENWTTQTIDQPANWYLMGGGSNGATGVIKTTDKSNGQFAAEMVTMLGDNNGVPRANSSGISTGYYLNNCGGPNCQRGGYPCTNLIDTLCFYYKYAPSGNDTASVNLALKNMGNTFMYTGQQIYTPAATYQFMQVPYNTMASPMDSIVITFQSSGYRDTALSFVGSDFKVDDVFFKSVGSGLSVSYFKDAPISVYPNPAFDGNFTVDNVKTHDLIRVLNVYGQEVSASIRKTNNKALVHVDAPGAYLVYVNAMGKITQQKVIVGKE